MLKMDLKFTDLSGEEVVETHYFHLSKADLVEMEVEHKGGLQNYFQQIVASEDGKAIIAAFREIILRSYGVKSDDGRRFVKNATLREEFLSSEAYSTLFMQLCTDAEAAANFVNGIIPNDMNTNQLRLDEAGEQSVPSSPALATEVEVNEITRPKQTEGRNVFEGASPTSVEPRTLTKAELEEMSDAELRSGLAEGRYKLS